MHDVTKDEVAERVREIARRTSDDESAHAAEDALHRAVLEAIATGTEDPAALAAEALRTQQLDFARWYA